MEIWLTSQGEKFQLPVNPEEFGESFSINHDDTVLADGEERTVIGGRNLREYTISSFFPAEHTHFTSVRPTKLSQPSSYVHTFKKWADEGRVILLQATYTDINLNVTIRDFDWKEVGGAVRDVEYTMVLKEYRPITFARLVKEDGVVVKPKPGRPNNKPTPPKNQRPPTNSTAPKTYVVLKGDSLWKIAKKIYKNGSLWRKIYDYPANKKLIGKDPNKLKVGMKLVIPKK